MQCNTHSLTHTEIQVEFRTEHIHSVICSQVNDTLPEFIAWTTISHYVDTDLCSSGFDRHNLWRAYTYMEHVFCTMCYVQCVLFTRIEIRALDLIYLNIYGRDAICGQIHQTKAIDDREGKWTQPISNKAKWMCQWNGFFPQKWYYYIRMTNRNDDDDDLIVGIAVIVRWFTVVGDKCTSKRKCNHAQMPISWNSREMTYFLVVHFSYAVGSLDLDCLQFEVCCRFRWKWMHHHRIKFSIFSLLLFKRNRALNEMILHTCFIQ